jgi:hypothetical protein
MDLTAEEFLKKMVLDNEEVSMVDVMVEFAKEHVKSALMAAHYDAVSQLDGRCWSMVYEKRFILKSYPEDKIK